jgi:hypothetical protein
MYYTSLTHCNSLPDQPTNESMSSNSKIPLRPQATGGQKKAGRTGWLLLFHLKMVEICREKDRQGFVWRGFSARDKTADGPQNPGNGESN